MKIQLCFSIKDYTDEDYDLLNTKLTTLKSQLDVEYDTDYTVHSCHLPRKLVIAAGFDTRCCDILENIFKDKYICEVNDNDLRVAMTNMNTYREELSKKVDRLVIIANKHLSNVKMEIECFTSNTIIII